MSYCIPIILGTAREGRETEKIFHFVKSRLSGRADLEVVPIDVRDFLFGRTIPSWENTDPRALEWRKVVSRSNGIIVVSPEYNHGYPGELKILLDSAYDEYSGKPLGIVSTSSGAFGGVRMTEQLRLSSIKMGLLPIRETVQVPDVENVFDESGIPKDHAFTKRVDAFLDAFFSTVKLLKHE